MGARAAEGLGTEGQQQGHPALQPLTSTWGTAAELLHLLHRLVLQLVQLAGDTQEQALVLSSTVSPAQEPQLFSGSLGAAGSGACDDTSARAGQQ